MSGNLLQTKLFAPPKRPNLVPRSHLTERLNHGLQLGHKLTLISTPAGFGKTTLIGEWIDNLRLTSDGNETGANRVAWLSLDEEDNVPTRFLAYLIAALQTVAPAVGEGALRALQSPQPPSPESILTALINDIAAVSHKILLVLDDYHVVDSQPIDDALTFLLANLPPQLHLVIATREDPNLPLARLRAQSRLTELRASDLRFTLEETAEFLNQIIGLSLSTDEIAALERRTEGWIVGLQLAAISMRGQEDAASFIQSFTGSHRFVLDYLVEEVLEQESERVQNFLLCTSILDRLCGPLCDAVLADAAGSGQETLAYLEQANLFIVPLDNERHWYRYHHLFADLLRQRMEQNPPLSFLPMTGKEGRIAKLHIRASQWYENYGLPVEALRHAAAANDVDRAARLVEGDGMPLQFRGAVAPVLNWLSSLPAAELNARPSLWVMYASALSMTGQTSGVEEKLQAAEEALQGAEPDDKTRNLVGHIAAIRALLAAVQYEVETTIAQSQRALEYLHPDNLAVRTATIWKMGFAYKLQGDRAAASRAYKEAISICEASGNAMINISATIGLGQVQEADTQLHLAAKTYRRVLELAGDLPLPIAGEAHLGLARICYQWNDLEAAGQHGEQSVRLTRQIENTDRFIACELFLARLKLAQGAPA